MDPLIGLFAAIGFFAQMVDGALSMAFGVIASSSLGADVLTVLPEEVVKPIVAIHLTLMAVLIILRVLDTRPNRCKPWSWSPLS
jgi:uncharacterized membrane protein YfcA